MATKWKNTVKKIQGFLKLHLTQEIYILGALLLFIGAALFYSVIVYRTWHITAEAIFLGVLGNLFMGAGLIIIFNALLKRLFGGMWMPEEDPYEAWKKTAHTVERRLCQAGGAALLCALWYLWHLVSGGVWNGGGWHYNYAAGYIMLFTVFVQFILLYAVLLRFRRKELDLLHEQQELDVRRKLEEVAEQGQKRLEEALEIERKSVEKVSRSDQLRVDLITNVSHDLKTPLTSMVGYLELIKKEELSDVIRDYVDVILERAEKLKEMINSLFNLAKASSGNVELHPEKFEVNRLIGQIFADMDDRIKESGLGLAIVSTYAKALGGEFDIKIDCDQFKACLKF